MSFQNCQVIGANVSSEAYHDQPAERGTPEFFVSPSSLKEFARCPARWKAGYASPGSKSMSWGNLLDCLALTPPLFDARYVVRPSTYLKKAMRCPSCESVTDSATCRKCKVDRVAIEVVEEWNGNSETCREWLAANAGRTVITEAEMAEVQQAVDRLRADELICEFLDASAKQLLVQGEWHDEPTGVVVPVRCLMDLVPAVDSVFGKCLGDLKTTASCAVMPFNRQVHKYGWHVQGAFDSDLYIAATGEDRTTWCLLAQENYPPFQPARRMLSQDYIALGRSFYTRAMRLYAACLKSGKWPDYDDHDETIQRWTLCAPEPWMESELMFAPKYETAEPETDDIEIEYLQ